MGTQYRMLLLLTALRIAPGYAMALQPLRNQLELAHGQAVSIDRLRTDCAWLAEQGLATFAHDVATLTTRGEDVVMGRARVPGVERPGA